MENNKSSLLVTTYNWESALEKVLESILLQTLLPVEVLIADDGSAQDTAQLIKRYQRTFPIPLIHCWQEDKGFRAATIRNKAIAKTTTDYVIMIDGDMLLHRNFIQDHINNAQRGLFIQGSRVITSPEKTEQILQYYGPTALQFNIFSSGISNRFNTLNSRFLRKIFSRIDKKLHATKTCNFSAWKEDLLAINGFNEDYIGWGREDSDLAARLIHIGKKRLKLKSMANAYHLYHDDNSRNRLSQNDILLDRCLQERHTYCVNGVDKYLNTI